jgi:hypothetical protein
MTFLSSERDAPGCRWRCCLRARATRFSAFRDRTVPIFEYTLKAASLKDPASAVPIYRKVAQSDEETTRFMDVLAGNIPFKEFFNPASLARLLA